GARGRVQTGDAQITEARLDVAPFAIEFLRPHAAGHFVRFAPAVQRNTGIALAIRGFLVETVIALGPEIRVRLKLMLLRLQFLNAQYVDILLGKPVVEPLAPGGADTVGIE